MAAKKLKEARSIFKKFHRRQLHGSGGQAVCEAWLRFEREHGSAEDLHQAEEKAQPVLDEALAAATAAAQPEIAAESKVSTPEMGVHRVDPAGLQMQFASLLLDLLYSTGPTICKKVLELHLMYDTLQDSSHDAVKPEYKW